MLDSMDRGGIQAFLMNIYRNIDRERIQFDFLLHTDKDCSYNNEIRSLGGRIFSIPARNQGVLINLKKLNEFFKEHTEYKIVHQHVSSLTYVEPLKVAQKHGVPIRIVHSHSTKQGGRHLHKYLHYFNQLSVKSYATHYFACSDLAAEWLYGKKQYDAGDYKIINNGIEVEKFIFNEKVRLERRKELGIKKDTLVLGHVGRFAYPKNHEFLIDIFKEVHKIIHDSILVLVGDGELRHPIEQKVNDLELQNNVIFTGVRSDIPDILQAMDAFVMPSHYEGLPVTLVEAQSAGLKCFVSNTITKQIAITDLIRYIPLDVAPDYWAEIIIKESDNNTRLNMLETIQNKGFDITMIADSLVNFYTNLEKGDFIEELQKKENRV